MNWLKSSAQRTATSSLLDDKTIGRIRHLRLTLCLVISLVIPGLGWAQALPMQNGVGPVVHIYPMSPNSHSRKSIFGASPDASTSFSASPGTSMGGPLFGTAVVGDLLFYGGPVISNLQVVVVYWGDNVSSVVTTGIPGFISAVTDSNYMDMLSEYSTNGLTPNGGGAPGNQSIGHGSLNGVYSITPSAANSGTTVDDIQIQAELLGQIDAGHLPAPTTDRNGVVTTEYMIYFPPGVTITLTGYSSCAQFCAYHSTVVHNLLDVPYGIMPDLGPGTGCSTGCAAGTELDDLTTVSSHELAESITDAAVGLATAYAPPLAWYDKLGGEIGDICNASGVPSMQTVLPGTSYTVQKEWSNLQKSCVSAPPKFALSAPASVLSGLLTVGLTVQSSTGAPLIPPYTGTVQFTSSDGSALLPSNYTFTASDNNAHTFGNSVTLKNLGPQTITVADTRSGGFFGTLQVTVNPRTSGYFVVTGPSSAASGTPFTFTVTALDSQSNPNPGYNGVVHFTSSDPLATLPANTTLINGAGTLTATLRAVGASSIAANDAGTPSISGMTSGILVGAGAATHFAVNAPASAIAGTSFTFTVTALDGAGNVSSGYAGTVHFTSSDLQATLPANTILRNGIGTFSAIRQTPGTQTITATDTVTTTISGVSGTISVGAPDLIESSFNVLTMAPISSGGSITVSDTATNQGLGNAGNSWTGFYLSNDGKTLGTFLTGRYVGTLAIGVSSGPATTSITLPNNLNGTYYLIACADYANAVVENNKTNNCTASAPIQVVGADLIESSFSVLTTAPISGGGSITVSDTTSNQGSGNAGNSWTGFYLSNNGMTLGSLLRSRYAGSVAAGASSGPATTSFTLPNNLNGTYYVIACADYLNAVRETNETNNCTTSAPIQVSGADLIESSFSILTTAPVSGGTISVSDTTSNQGLGNAGNSWTGFYLSSDGITTGSLLKSRYAGSVAAGASSPATTSLTLPNNLNGTYYVIACSDYLNAVIETNETNNCKTSAPIQVSGADLIESSFSVLTTAPVSGGTISVSDTTSNQGPGNAGNSWTGFYLSSDGITPGSLLKSRYVGSVAVGASSGPATTSFTLPNNLNGTYYVIACSDYLNAVIETNETNNCTASAPIQVH